MNTIFPDVIRALELTSTEVQWVQESYVLVFASLLLVWGSLADRIGRKRVLIIGIAIFVASSVWAGVVFCRSGSRLHLDNPWNRVDGCCRFGE